MEIIFTLAASQERIDLTGLKKVCLQPGQEKSLCITGMIDLDPNKQMYLPIIHIKQEDLVEVRKKLHQRIDDILNEFEIVYKENK